METLPQSLAALEAYPQFILVKWVNEKGKINKIPVDRYGNAADAHDNTNWYTAEQALHIASTCGLEIGFVFTEKDPFWFLDIDHCLTKKGWSRLAQKLINTFAGAAIEVSASNKGLHIFGTGKCPPHRTRDTQSLGLEFYTEKRFVALTGTHASGDISKDFTAVLPEFIKEYFYLQPDIAPHLWTSEPCEVWDGSTDDDELIKRALRSKSGRAVFGDAASFKDLWEANEAVLAKAFPPERAGAWNQSAADAALAQHLAFWTGNNCERIRNLMGRSQLIREKWERKDYLYRTILNACSVQKTWCVDKKKLQNLTTKEDLSNKETSTVTHEKNIPVSGFLSIDQQVQLFEGCTYVRDEHKILIPGGDLLKSEQFNVVYGGYIFPLDPANQMRPTRKAWEAALESQCFKIPHAHSSCFHPQSAPGVIENVYGRNLVNIYYPAHIIKTPCDVQPFLIHLHKLFPDETDFQIILAYLAALMQYPGKKFMWCPFIQGVPGNGKSMLIMIMVRALGLQYCHLPKASEISAKFNAWLYKKLFIGVDDIYVDAAVTSVLETLKPMITSEYQGVEAKGVDQVTREVCANFIINSNHKDGLRKSSDDRRLAYFYTPQQTVDDLTRDGMTTEYFIKLRAWLSECGQHGINHFLCEYDIPAEFNPAGACIRAPKTSSTDEAIQEGRGIVEQEILEAVAQGQPGFRGGWISSIMLDRWLTQQRVAYLANRKMRPRILASLGYVTHSKSTTRGRTGFPVQPDGARTILYLRKGHIALNYDSQDAVTRAYSEAQSDSFQITENISSKP